MTGHPRYRVIVDNEAFPARSVAHVRSILDSAVSLSREASVLPSSISVTTGSGNASTSQAIADAVKSANKAITMVEVDREISQRMQEKLRQEDDEITVLLLS